MSPHKIGRSENPQARQTQLNDEARRRHGKEYVHTIIVIRKDCGMLERLIHQESLSSRLSEDLLESFVLPAMSGSAFQELLGVQSDQALLQWNAFRRKQKEKAGDSEEAFAEC